MLIHLEQIIKSFVLGIHKNLYTQIIQLITFYCAGTCYVRNPITTNTTVEKLSLDNSAIGVTGLLTSGSTRSMCINCSFFMLSEQDLEIKQFHI